VLVAAVWPCAGSKHPAQLLHARPRRADGISAAEVNMVMSGWTVCVGKTEDSFFSHRGRRTRVGAMSPAVGGASLSLLPQPRQSKLRRLDKTPHHFFSPSHLYYQALLAENGVTGTHRPLSEPLLHHLSFLLSPHCPGWLAAGAVPSAINVYSLLACFAVIDQQHTVKTLAAML